MPDASRQDAIEAVRHINVDGGAGVILVCEHASAHIPARFGDLGLGPASRTAHIAWDPGALAVAEGLSAALDARLVAGCVSRLVYDCNRPPDSPTAMPSRSEVHDIPGNDNLTPAQRADRVRLIHDPFKAAVTQAMTSRPRPILVTIHSFTPVFDGTPRATEIGVLHDDDARLADGLLATAPPGWRVERNRPYGPEDGVTHTLRLHALAHGHPNVMLEIRNDLIATAADQARMVDMLAPWLTRAVAALSATEARA